MADNTDYLTLFYAKTDIIEGFKVFSFLYRFAA
jgi:hypothetical protein